MTAFVEVENLRFQARLGEYLRKTYGDLPVHSVSSSTPLKSIGDKELFAMVGLCIEKAHSWRLSWESSIAAFAALMFVNGPFFDQHRTIQNEMQSPSVPLNSLPDHLALVIPESVWKQARAGYRERLKWTVQSPGQY